MRRWLLLGLGISATMIAIIAVYSRKSAVQPSIILVVIDTLRADHLGCYGYTRPTSPNIDALAARGVLFERSVSQAPWTGPSVASLFTGKPPIGHGAIGSVLGGRAALAESQTTLAEIFRAHGYRTAAFITNPNIVDDLGFKQGFEVFETRLMASARVVTTWALEQLDRKDPRPLFLYLHYMDPHSPYQAPRKFRSALTPTARGRLGKEVKTELLQAVNFSGFELTPEELAYVVGLYDAEIAFTDSEIGGLVEGLDARGGLASPRAGARPLYLALTSDHGEEMKDHGGLFHGYTAYRELTHVPLLMVGPDVPARRVSSVVRSVDVPATLLDLAALPPAPDATGDSLRPLFTGAAPDRPALSQAEMLTKFKPVKLRALETAEWKYVEDDVAQQAHLFDLQSDPHEQHDLVAAQPEAAEAMKAQMASLFAAIPAANAETVELDAEQNERLRQLGY